MRDEGRPRHNRDVTHSAATPGHSSTGQASTDPSPLPSAPPHIDAEVLTVGFDLDMTLVDSGAGIVATMQAVFGEHDLDVADEEVWSRIGTPLEHMFAPFVIPEAVPQAVLRYRELYPTTGVRGVTLLPGALEAVASVRSLGGRVVVVSAKVESAVLLVLDEVGLAVDAVVGGLFAADKGSALTRHSVLIYVGDHVGDVEGARAAGATSVAVTSGPQDAETLRAAGADVVLGSLTELPHWLHEHVHQLRGQGA